MSAEVLTSEVDLVDILTGGTYELLYIEVNDMFVSRRVHCLVHNLSVSAASSCLEII
jgi:hypothetical protein